MKKKSGIQKTTPRKIKKPQVTKILVSENCSTEKKMETDRFSLGRAGGSVQNTFAYATQTGRRGAEVLGTNVGSTTSVMFNAPVAVSRSRHAVKTNPYAKSAIDKLVSNVVGNGHKMISLAPDSVFKKQVEELWQEWSTYADTSGKLNFGGIESLAFRSMAEGGDCFVRMRVRRPEDNLPVPLQLQIYESEQVPYTKNEIKGGNKIIAGVEFNGIDQPVFYHMLRNHPGEFSPFSLGSEINLETIMVQADEVIHLHDVKRPNEVRGLPILSQALVKLSDLDKYMDAELMRKKACALIGGFIKQPNDGTNLNNPFVTQDETPEEDSDVHIEAIEPGTFPVLPAGYEVEFSDPADVGANFEPFLRQELLMVCAVVGVTYEQLTGDMKHVNDRTLRASLLEFKRLAEAYQNNILVHQFCRRIFDKWFDLAVISGELKIPAGVTLRQAKKVKWIAHPWAYMNPTQEINAQISEVRAGMKSRSETIIERGGSPEEVDEQIKLEKDREKQLELIYTTNAGAVNDTGSTHNLPPQNIVEGVTGNEEN